LDRTSRWAALRQPLVSSVSVGQEISAVPLSLRPRDWHTNRPDRLAATCRGRCR